MKSACFVSLLAVALTLSSCYAAHSGSSGGLSSGGGGSTGGTGGGGTGGSGGSGGSTSFTVSGTVIGLTGTGLILEDNGTDDVTVAGNGGFTFKTSVSGPYNVLVKTQPLGPAQTCTISNGTGSAIANVTNVVVNCGTSALTIGGSVSGLNGSGMVLADNGTDKLTVSGKGNVTFTFGVPVAPGGAYAVTIVTQPSNPAQVCSILNGSGTANGNVNSVQVACTQPGFTVGGSVVGLIVGPGDTLELQNNAGDDLFVTGDTSFVFPTKVTNGGIYNVGLFIPPASQPQTCTMFAYTGIASSNVSDVVVDCQHNDWNWLTWYVGSTNLSNNYSAVTTPLFPVNQVPPANLNTPGGRDFASAWTDKTGRKWLFGGFGFPYPSPVAKQIQGYLNDLWVFDEGAGGWVPANVKTILPPLATQWIVDPTQLEAENIASDVVPGSRWGGSSWTDTTGNLWMFGGQGFSTVPGVIHSVLLNDIWKCTPGASVDANGAGSASCPWVRVGGSTSGNTAGSYGTQGVAGGFPGGRWAAATTTDTSGNVWMFGGQGVDSSGTTGLLGDLWEFNSSANQWTWVGPSNSNTANHNGSYGTLGTGSGTTAPGSRQAAVMWADSTGNIWLFGGFGLDSGGTGGPAGAILNDLWEFNVTTKQWTWISGSNTANQTGTYGTQAVDNTSTGAATSVPGSRWGAVGWPDSNDNLWFFGGWGYGTSTTAATGFLNDIWEYQKSSGQWIWWKGISNANQNGAYVTKGIPFVNNVAGARRGAAIWQPDANHYIRVFGGEGYDSTQGAPPGYLNDFWTYLPFP